VSDVVHVITDLGPTDGPGLVVPAELLGPALHIRHTNDPCQRIPLWYYPAHPMEDS
jgi:hypothetical protein